MHKCISHEVATPLQLDVEDMEWGVFLAENDGSYEDYCRQLGGSTYHIAWQSHECSYCDEIIRSGEWYARTVYLSKKDGKKKVFVEKKHDPVCPKELRDFEEEMRREREREELAARRKAA